jgi:hypothetical protein
MKKTGMPVIAWVLVGLLAIAAGLISLGHQDSEAQPEVSSFSPSGVSAFAELLRKSGIQVEVRTESKPKIEPNDVVVAFRIVGSDSDSEPDDGSPQDRFNKNFWTAIDRGAMGIELHLKEDYLSASRETAKTPYVTVTDHSTGASYKVTDSGLTDANAFDEADDKDASAHLSLWQDKGGAFLKAYRYGKGTLLVPRDGIGITNRFIDKYDNAKAFSNLFSILTGKGKRVIFAEASFGNVHDPGLLEMIGPWANAAWQQLIFLGIVVVFTLGKRFGYPDESRSTQRSSRELLDAVADTYQRAHSTQATLATAYVAADTDLRLVLKLAKDAPRTDRDRVLPVSLQNALARLQVASEFPAVTPDHALSLIMETQKELEAFLGPNRAKLRSLAKLKA